MRRLQRQPAETPSLGDVHFKELYRKETYDARTGDGWVLQLTRYQPVEQRWRQPMLGQPLLLVPGWSQNRHAFTSGHFVKQLLIDGADVHILELRGHGKSSRELQLQRAASEGRPPPADLDWGWDLDSHLLEDVPAAVDAVRARTGRPRIFYVGASMGGMLGYGYAAQHGQNLAGLVTLGAASDLGQGFPLLRALALLVPTLVHPVIDALCGALSGAGIARHAAAGLLRELRWLRHAADHVHHPGEPQAVRFLHFPMDAALGLVARTVTAESLRRVDRLARALPSLANPARVKADDFRWLLREGSDKEPRKVVEQFARWIRNDEMKCYRTGFDYRAHFKDIRVPLAVIFGDLDPIASERSTRSVYRNAGSDYVVYRALKDNSHLELTMGYDIADVCADIRALVEYAAGREQRRAAIRAV